MELMPEPVTKAKAGSESLAPGCRMYERGNLRAKNKENARLLDLFERAHRSGDLQFVGRTSWLFDTRHLPATQYRVTLVKRSLIDR
jgi:hypothetical protein